MHTHRTLPLLLALFALIGWFGLPQASTAQEPVTLTMSTGEVGVAETTVVEARLACPPGGCASFEIELTFDRSLIRIQRAILGPYLGADAFEAENRVDNPAGRVRLVAEATNPPAGTDDLLFQLEVYGLVPGTTELVVESLVVNDAAQAPRQ